MIIRSALHCALLLALASPAWSAQKHPPKKTAQPASKAHTKRGVKPPAKKAAAARPKTLTNTALRPHAAKPAVLHGRKEVLTCRDGTEDRHARIAVVTIGGKVDSFAYYSKWKPRTCSIYLQRNRDTSKWSDAGNVTSVSANRGAFIIENGKGVYKFGFRDVDRERYCGMDGRINGTLTIRKGSERCEIAGIMDEGVPLGEAAAYAQAQAAAAAAAAETAAADAAPTTAAAAPAVVASAAPTTPRAKPSGEHSLLKRFAQYFHREPSATYPSSSVIVGD